MLFRSDRKSTRLNSSHTLISYAVFCLKKKKTDHVRNSQHLTADPEKPSHTHRVQTRYGFLSSYPPTRCGLATFTASLYAFFFLRIRRPRRFTLFPYTTPSR